MTRARICACCASVRTWTVLAAAGCALLLPVRAAAQSNGDGTDDERRILRLEATPIGALPQIALPMPASRNHNYWTVRLQAGQRRSRGAGDLRALAGGIDLQWRGGSLFGITAGQQQRECAVGEGDCGGHKLFGARARFNVLTGGPTIGALLGDYSATSTLGAELGFGFAPDAMPGLNACTIDIGMPLSLAMLQRVRLVTYFTPTVVWDIACSPGAPPTRLAYLASMGIGIQQLGLRGLDAYVGVQKIMLGHTGYQVGISVTYVRLP